MAIQTIPAGTAKVLTAGQNLNIKSSNGVMVGIACSVAGTMNVYDDPALGTTTPLGLAIALSTGWNPFPVCFSQGLNVALTTAAGSVVYI